jgi:hypothetical protein
MDLRGQDARAYSDDDIVDFDRIESYESSFVSGFGSPLV